MMDVSAAGQYGVYTANSAQTNQADSGLSMNDFFKLMAAQLENQSMFDPVDNTEYISQMAQFSVLSQMQQLQNTFSKSYAVSLLGKNVTLSGIDETGDTFTATGLVENVCYISDVPYVEIDDILYPASGVFLVNNG